MKALVYTAPRRLEIQDIPKPAPKAGEVLIRVRASGVCGSDLHGFLGHSKLRVPPLVLGHEFSGEVAEAGPGVTRFHAGDAVAVYPLVTCGRCVYCATGRHHICPQRTLFGLHFHGGLAEYVAAPEACCFRLPAGMSFPDGALVEPLANALHVVGRCPVVKDATGIVFGAGSIGLLVWWAARHRDARRIALVDRNPRRLAMLKSLGADLTVDASAEDPAAALMKWTDGHGAEFTVDAVGNAVCRRNALAVTAWGGASVWIGLEEDAYELSGLDLVRREIDVRGSYAYTLNDFADAVSILERKLLPSAQFVTEVALDRGQAVFEELTGGRSAITKAIFTI